MENILWKQISKEDYFDGALYCKALRLDFGLQVRYYESHLEVLMLMVNFVSNCDNNMLSIKSIYESVISVVLKDIQIFRILSRYSRKHIFPRFRYYYLPFIY